MLHRRMQHSPPRDHNYLGASLSARLPHSHYRTVYLIFPKNCRLTSIARAVLIHCNIHFVPIHNHPDWKMERSHDRVGPRKIPKEPPCVCQPFHSGCDPELCDKAVEPPRKSWIEKNGPVETLFIYARIEEWDEGARRGCMTCAVVSKIGGKYVRPEERVAVQRKAGECSIFGQYVYKDSNDCKSRSMKFASTELTTKKPQRGLVMRFPQHYFRIPKARIRIRLSNPAKLG